MLLYTAGHLRMVEVEGTVNPHVGPVQSPDEDRG